MTINWTPHAKRELTQILDYCIYNFGKKTAQQFFVKLNSILQSLRINPNMGRKEDLLHQSKYIVRSIPLGHFRIIYCVNNDLQVLVVLSLFDCRQDPTKLLSEIN